MSSKNIYKLIILVIALLLGQSYSVSGQESVEVEDGYIDLTRYDFDELNFELQGDWTFYEDKLLSPEEVKKQKKVGYGIGKMKVPGYWNSVGKTFFSGGFGYGTYHLKFKVAPRHKILNMNICRVLTAYKIWINDTLMGGVGEVGVNRRTSEGVWNCANYVFFNQGVNDVVIQMSNFQYATGGFKYAPIIGLPRNTDKYSWSVLGVDFLLIGLLLAMTVYQISTYRIKKDRLFLFFGLLTASFLAFSLVSNRLILAFMFPGLPIRLMGFLNYASNLLRFQFLGLFYVLMFPSPFRRKIARFSTILVGIVVIMFALMPFSVYSRFLIMFIIYISLLMLYLMVLLFKSVLQKKEFAIFYFISLIILFVLTLLDTSKEANLLSRPFYATYGVVLIVYIRTAYVIFEDRKTLKNVASSAELKRVSNKIRNELLAGGNVDIKKLLYVGASNISSNFTVVLVWDNGVWIKRIEYFYGKIINYIDPEDAEAKNILAFDRELIDECVRTKKITLGYDDNNLITRLLTPMVIDGEVNVISYSENFEKSKYFNDNALKYTRLITPQFSVLVDNYRMMAKLSQINKVLEATANEQIEEIMQQTEELRVQQEEIEHHNEELDEAIKKLDLQNRHIGDSINYAKNFQKAIMPSDERIRKLFPDYFVYYKSKEVLSGNFYQVGRTYFEGDKYKLFTVADTQNNGVPGALLGIVGSNIVNSAIFDKSVHLPSEVLNVLVEKFVTSLHGEEGDADIHVDISVLALNENTRELFYSGIEQDLYVCSAGVVNVYSGIIRNDDGSLPVSKFVDHKILLEGEATVYFFTKGYINEIVDGEHLLTKKEFNKLLLETSKMPLDEQSAHLMSVFDEQTGSEIKQKDDILIVALKI